ncbi:MAG: hypothetical protein U1F77_19235 [Kiritimatiellia bacterium]
MKARLAIPGVLVLAVIGWVAGCGSSTPSSSAPLPVPEAAERLEKAARKLADPLRQTLLDQAASMRSDPAETALERIESLRAPPGFPAAAELLESARVSLLYQLQKNHPDPAHAPDAYRKLLERR